jgi:tungstate transport system ATP-binding protein
MIVLKLNNLKKIYDGTTVLDIDELEFETGKITAIIGPSGSGKSTMLSVINGITKPDEGSVLFEEYEFSRGSKTYPKMIRRKMAMIFQKPVLFNTSVFNNIAYGLVARKTGKAEIIKNVKDIAVTIGLENKLEQKAVTLSGGEGGRVSIARALVIKPKLLLMDEPTASLDPKNISIIENIILNAKRSMDTSIIIVTHNMFQAKRLADNVIFLLDGKIIEYGTCDQIFNNPKNEQTRAFIHGDMVF